MTHFGVSKFIGLSKDYFNKLKHLNFDIFLQRKNHFHGINVLFAKDFHSKIYLFSFDLQTKNECCACFKINERICIRLS